MKLRYAALFTSFALITSAALAEPCVKVRAGESYACMKFSSAEKRDAAKYGLHVGAPFSHNKRALLQQGWLVDKQWLTDGDAEPSDGREMVCGSGLDAVCQSAFRKNDLVLLLTLSGVNEGMPPLLISRL